MTLPAGHPAPEVLARPAQPEEVPRGTKPVLKVVGGAWSVQGTYARGTSLSKKAPHGPGPVVQSYALRCSHPDGRRAVAVWTDGSFEMAWLWRDQPGDPPTAVDTRKANVKEVKAWLAT